jgi:Bacterial protein of unknown function (DUF916)
MSRLARVFITGCLVTLTLAAPAAAQPAQAGFALSAAGFDSYFRYRVTPGGSEAGTVQLTNLSERPVTVLLRAADVTTAATGGLQYGSAPPGGDAQWLTLDRSRLRLAVGGAQSVRFRLRVPASATPGDHFAGIVALNGRDLRMARRRPAARGLQLRFLPRLAIAAQTTIPGGNTWQLQAGNANIEVTPSATNATLQLRNTGNRLVPATSGNLSLLQGSTPLVHHHVRLDSFVPNTQITVRVPFEGIPAHGTYRLRGTLHPSGGKPVHVDEEISFDETAARELRRETGQQAKSAGVPTLLAGVAGAALLLVIATLAALLRRQRRLSNPPAGA